MTEEIQYITCIFIISITPFYQKITRFSSYNSLISHRINQIAKYQVCNHVIFKAGANSFKIWYLITIELPSIINLYSFQARGVGTYDNVRWEVKVIQTISNLLLTQQIADSIIILSQISKQMRLHVICQVNGVNIRIILQVFYKSEIVRCIIHTCQFYSSQINRIK